MKNKAERFLFIILLTCSSCSSVYQFSIDIQEPASVTLPVSAQNVLILNNIVVQPENYGIDRTLEKQPVPANFSLSLDSMVWSAMNEIANVLDESKFFNSISIYRKPVNTGSGWHVSSELSPGLQSVFYDQEGFDALLVIDRLIFSVKEDIKKHNALVTTYEPIVISDLRTEGIITCSMYSYETKKALTTFSISDSLFAKSAFSLRDSTYIFKEFPEFILLDLSYKLGNHVAKRIIPTWKTENRVLFLNHNARMQEAAGYAANSQWEKAESIWMAEFDKKTKPADKAKIAFNLAVTNEMKDKIEPALTWAQKVKEYLKNVNPDDNHQKIELTTDQYISKLEQRIQNNRLLDLQWGKE